MMQTETPIAAGGPAPRRALQVGWGCGGADPASMSPPDCDVLLSAMMRLDGILGRAVATAERVHGPEAAADPYRGLHIDRRDVDRLLDAGPGGRSLYTRGPGSESGVERSAPSRLDDLARTCDLSSFDIDVLLLALAPDLDLRYERLFGYLQDDVTKRRASVDLALSLLCESFAAGLRARGRFRQDAPLLARGVIRLIDDPAHQHPTLLGKFIMVEERIVSFLLGSEALAESLLPYTRLVEPQASLEDLIFPPEIKLGLIRLADRAKGEDRRLVLQLHGPHGVGRRTTAEAMCRELGSRLLVVDVRRLLQVEAAGTPVAIHLIFREAALQGAAVCWEGADALLADDHAPARSALVRNLERCQSLMFLLGDARWEQCDELRDVALVSAELPRPGYGQRADLWARALGRCPLPMPGVDSGPLVNKFRLTGGQIEDALATAREIARWREPEDGRMAMADLASACRRQSSRRLGKVARRITPHHAWSDIVLPADRLQHLREICDSVKHRALIYDEWGFDRKLSLGKGLNILFAGPSGTGKTMAADIMAGDLALDLYKIDLSTVVDKYIGETEKNLARIFAEAEASDAILFFDEADALFGKRSEVRDAHDRYANVEINYLLQKMEEHEGVVILATNFRKNMDEAFVRRMHHAVEFPFPGEADRRRIWSCVWPAETPHAPDVDLDVMAQRFEIAGGNIRNIALASAFLAARDGSAITMGHLLHSARREYQKMGKVVVGGEFEDARAVPA